MLSSAQLSWAASVINLLCDYCQSETPPPRRSALMGTMSPGTASHGGWDERSRGEKKKKRMRRRKRNTVGREMEKYQGLREKRFQKRWRKEN